MNAPSNVPSYWPRYSPAYCPKKDFEYCFKKFLLYDPSYGDANKPEYTPHNDVGDYVVVINAEKIKVTGNKNEQKMYYRHTGYPGGIKSQNFNDLIASYPDRIITSAVKGMLPKNKLSNSVMKKLKVYKGESHPHSAQNPVKLEI